MIEAAVINHFDVAGDDLGALTRFYQELFGWEVTPRGPGYAQVCTPSLRGALIESQHACFTVGLTVPDLYLALERAVAEGGSLAMPATDNGWVRKGQVRDPAGNLLTIIQG